MLLPLTPPRDAGPVIDNSLDIVRKTFETNTFSILRVAQTVIPEMAKRKEGVIVNIGSIVGEMYVLLFSSPRDAALFNQSYSMERDLLRLKGSSTFH